MAKLQIKLCLEGHMELSLKEMGLFMFGRKHFSKYGIADTVLK